MERKEEIPHDKHDLVDSSSGKLKHNLSSLYEGSDLNSYTMIPNQKHRAFLWKLYQRKPVTNLDWQSFQNFLRKEQREALLPYILVSGVVFACTLCVRVFVCTCPFVCTCLNTLSLVWMCVTICISILCICLYVFLSLFIYYLFIIIITYYSCIII